MTAIIVKIKDIIKFIPVLAKNAEVRVPTTDFGLYVEISVDGDTWVGQGEGIGLDPQAER